MLLVFVSHNVETLTTKHGFSNMTEPRLAYKDRYVRNILGDITEDTSQDTVSNELALPLNQKQYLVLNVTGEEYKDMFSSMLQGSELIFPDKAQQLLWLFWKAAKDMTFCDAVNHCLVNNPETIDIINDIINNGGNSGGVGNPDKPLSDEVMQKDFLENSSCNPDKLWGASEYVIDGVFDTTLEVLQRISLATEPLEAIGEITQIVPIIGDIAGMAVNLIDWVTDTALALFETVDSAVVREDLACQLRCLGSTTCELNMDMVKEVFVSNAVEPYPLTEGIEDKLLWLFNLILSGNPNLNIASTICLLGVFTMEYGGDFGANVLNTRTLGQLAALGAANNENNNWTIVCDACAVCTIYDFTVSEQGWYGATYGNIYDPRAIYNTDKWGPKLGTQALQGQVLIEFNYAGPLSKIRIILDSPLEDSGLGGGGVFRYEIDGTTIDSYYGVGDTEHTFYLSPEVNVTASVVVGIIYQSGAGTSYPICPNSIIGVELCD